MEPNEALKLFALMLGDPRNGGSFDKKKARGLADGTSPLFAIYYTDSMIHEEPAHRYRIYRIHEGKELLFASMACSVADYKKSIFPKCGTHSLECWFRKHGG